MPLSAVLLRRRLSVLIASLAQTALPKGDLPVDCTKQAIANANHPANRRSGQACLSVRLSAQVMVPQQQQQQQQQPNSGGYVLGARLVRARSIQEVKGMLGAPASLQDAVKELQDKVGVLVSGGWCLEVACMHGAHLVLGWTRHGWCTVRTWQHLCAARRQQHWSMRTTCCS
jgi:hypothetical protein